LAVEHLGTRDVPIADLTFFPGNARRGNVDEIRKSVRRLGQYARSRPRHGRRSGDPRRESHRAGDAGRGLQDGPLRDHPLHRRRSPPRQHLGQQTRRTTRPDGFRYDDDELVQLLSYLEDDYEGTGWTAEDVDALIGSGEELPPAAVATRTTYRSRQRSRSVR